MAKTWAKFYDEVLPEVQGCPQALANYAIAKAAISFCEKSRIYRLDHTPINVVAGTSSYDWAPGTSLVVVRAEKVWYNAKPLEAKSSKELDAIYDNWPAESGTPLYFLQERADKLILVPNPAAALTAGLTAKVSVTPANDAVDIIDWIWQEYVEEIGRGAKAMLMNMDSKPWSNPAKAAKYDAEFEADIGKANLRAERGFTRATVSSTRLARRFL